MQKRSDFTTEEVQRLNCELQQQLGPEFLRQRTGPGGKFTYIEGQSAIQLANEHFGFNGWSSELRSLTVDFVDESDGKVSVGVSAIVRITLKDGTFHEDIGYGQMENSKSKAAAMEKAKKEAATDAMKRALRMFGNVLGNCIYDKTYTSHVQYMKAPAIKFDPKNLYRDKRYLVQQQQQQQQQQQKEQESSKPQQSSPSSPQKQQQQPASSNMSSSSTLVASAYTNNNNSNNSNRQQQAAAPSRRPPPPLTRSASRQMQQQQWQQRQPTTNTTTSTTSTTTTTTTTKSTLPPPSFSAPAQKPSNNEVPVVSPLPPNQPPPLRSTLSREDSFSMEGDEDFYAEVIAQEMDFDKPDIESQPITEPEPALQFSWSSNSSSGNKRNLEEASESFSTANATSTAARKSPKTRR